MAYHTIEIRQMKLVTMPWDFVVEHDAEDDSMLWVKYTIFDLMKLPERPGYIGIDLANQGFTVVHASDTRNLQKIS